MSVLHIAREYTRAGIGVIPLTLDGDKKPACGSWKPYQTAIADDDQLRRWFFRDRGLAMVCGRVSGGLEVIDFDDWTCFEPWKEQCDPAVLSWLPVIETGRGGFHVLYRCCEIAGNTKLAMLDDDGRKEKDRTRIETRGEGGYIVAVGSPLSVHKSGNPYVQLAGQPLPAIPTIEPDERRMLWRAAQRFDLSGMFDDAVKQHCRKIEAARRPKKVNRPDGVVTPWEDMDARGDLPGILTQAGCVDLGGGYWSRPRDDGNHHTSAKINTSQTSGHQVLTVFSTNFPGKLTPGNGGGIDRSTFGIFEVYKRLLHGGDGTAAGIAAANLGYGSKVDLSAITEQARRVSA